MDCWKTNVNEPRPDHVPTTLKTILLPALFLFALATATPAQTSREVSREEEEMIDE